MADQHNAEKSDRRNRIYGSDHDPKRRYTILCYLVTWKVWMVIEVLLHHWRCQEELCVNIFFTEISTRLDIVKIAFLSSLPPSNEKHRMEAWEIFNRRAVRCDRSTSSYPCTVLWDFLRAKGSTCNTYANALIVLWEAPWKIIPLGLVDCTPRVCTGPDVIVTRRWLANDRFHKIARVPRKTSMHTRQEAVAFGRFKPEAEFSRSLHLVQRRLRCTCTRRRV